MNKKTILILFFFLIVTKFFSQTSEFILNVSDTSAFDLIINLTTDKQILSKYSIYFTKPPHTDTIEVHKCVDCPEFRKEFCTNYEIKVNTLNIICRTYGADLLDKKIDVIIINASSPTKTNLSNFILGKSLVKDVEREFYTKVNADRSWSVLISERERNYWYLEKIEKHFYFGTPRVSQKKIKKNQVVDRILISNYLW